MLYHVHIVFSLATASYTYCFISSLGAFKMSVLPAISHSKLEDVRWIAYLVPALGPTKSHSIVLVKDISRHHFFSKQRDTTVM